MGHNARMIISPGSRPATIPPALLCLMWLVTAAAGPAAAFGSGPTAPGGDGGPALHLSQNDIWTQFFERNRRRNDANRRRRPDLDIMPLRTDPRAQQPRPRQFRRPDRTRSQRREQDAARDAVRRGDILPLGGIIRAARAYCPGKFLGARLLRGRNGFSYHVRILRPSGRRIGLTVDAKSGAVVGGRCR